MQNEKLSLPNKDEKQDEHSSQKSMSFADQEETKDEIKPLNSLDEIQDTNKEIFL